MTRLDQLRQRAAESDAYLARALDEALACLVPESDLAPTTEPVTVTGYYRQPTLSGRAAWRYCYWVSGRLLSKPATYSRASEDHLLEAADRFYCAHKDLKAEEEFAKLCYPKTRKEGP